MTPTFCSRFVTAMVVLICSTAATAASTAKKIDTPWDLSGILGTGQSLSVGAQGDRHPTTQPSGPNLQLSTDTLAWPADPGDPHLKLVPLTALVGRLSKAYPSSWPDNIDGLTWHGAMASQLSAMVKASTGHDFTSVQGEVGESGQGVVFLKKNAVPRGVNGRSYAAAMIWCRAVTRLAKVEHKSFGVGAVILTHGESDAGNQHYESEIHQLQRDYDSDIKAITGQARDVQLILSQQNSVWPISTIAQWKLGVDYPADIVCSGPKYQYLYAADSVHLQSIGYEQLGEKYAQVYYERVLCGRPWQPLQPLSAQRHGRSIMIAYHVPVGPMVWDTVFSQPHASIPQWRRGRGFEVVAANGSKVTIDHVGISKESVEITCVSDPGANVHVSYATVGEEVAMSKPFHGTKRWGLLRDSDPFTGVVTGKTQSNYSVAFEMLVP